MLWCFECLWEGVEATCSLSSPSQVKNSSAKGPAPMQPAAVDIIDVYRSVNSSTVVPVADWGRSWHVTRHESNTSASASFRSLEVLTSCIPASARDCMSACHAAPYAGLAPSGVEVAVVKIVCMGFSNLLNRERTHLGSSLGSCSGCMA